MSLEGALLAQWDGYHPLREMIPGTRVFTGRHFGAVELPYAVIRRGEAREQRRTSSGNLYEQRPYQVLVYSTSLSESRNVADALRTRFDRRTFGWSTGSCLDFRWSDQRDELGEDGIWLTEVEFVATLEQPSG
jgi:hypothetical protein